MGAEAVSYLERAGRRAAQLFANEEGLSHLRRALAIAESEQLPAVSVATIVLALARLEEHIGAYEASLDLYKRAGALTNDLACEIGLASVLGTLGRHEEALHVLDQARSAHPEPTPTEAAALALEQGRVLFQLGEHDSAMAMLEAGLAEAAGRDPQLEGQILLQLSRILQIAEVLSESIANAEQACRLFEEIEDVAQLARSLRVLGGLQCDAAKDDRAGLERARGTLEHAGVLARRVGNAEEQVASLINLGRTLSMLGDHAAALDATQEALTASQRVGNLNGVACAYCNLADYLGELERWEEAREAAEAGLTVAEEIATPIWITGALLGISWAEQALGNSERAAAAAERAFELALAHNLGDRARHAIEYAIDAHRSLGNADRVRELREHEADLALH
jgi:tetratricopeptide (TPR) repeat protein